MVREDNIAGFLLHWRQYLQLKATFRPALFKIDMVWLLFREKVPRSTFEQTEKVRKPRFLRAVSGNPHKDARENFRLLKDFLLNNDSQIIFYWICIELIYYTKIIKEIKDD